MRRRIGREEVEGKDDDEKEEKRMSLTRERGHNRQKERVKKKVLQCRERKC